MNNEPNMSPADLIRAKARRDKTAASAMAAMAEEKSITADKLFALAARADAAADDALQAIIDEFDSIAREDNAQMHRFLPMLKP